ncbi:hypothetical protein GOV12_06075 [Candidatus Pacearchaeota archaeon]|nr:hypothetical protein [Candidatus Pacearchaeota archaeon]
MENSDDVAKYRNDILNYQIEIRKKQFTIERWIIFFGVLTLGGFLFLIFSIRDATLTGFVVGEGEANLYGLMILGIFLVVWGFLLLQWFIVHKNNPKM